MEGLDLSENEKFVIELLKGQENNKMGYKDMQDACEEKFEGLRLVLKTLKEKGIVNYSGVMPGYSSEIKLSNLTFI